MHKILNVALIAHDNKKDTLVNFCIAYEAILSKYGLYATGTTGKRIMDETIGLLLGLLVGTNKLGLRL